MPVRPKQIALVCGLGNPGDEYARTRHSIGFATVDALAARAGVTYWKSQAGCEVATMRVRGEDGPREVVLAKPQSYMNTSGGPLSKLMRELRISPAEVLVVHDEVDLPEGAVRVKFGGGLNAHNGLRSISDKLKTRDFARVRCGIGRPPGKMSVADWALRQLKGSFLEEFELLAQDAADAVETCLTQGVDEGVRRTS
jgi:PTH1 family peptidyl-tRNA hydrolase